MKQTVDILFSGEGRVSGVSADSAVKAKYLLLSFVIQPGCRIQSLIMTLSPCPQLLFESGSAAANRGASVIKSLTDSQSGLNILETL